jgi:hypothetical protein
VSFRDQDSQDQRWRTMTRPADEFIRRLLQPVLPQGFHNVRYDGLWSPVHRPLLRQLQLSLAGHTAAHSSERVNPVHPAVRGCWS